MTDLPKIWCTILPLPKEKSWEAVEVVCLHKEHDLRYKADHISHLVAGLILNITFQIEDPDGVGDTVNISLFTYLCTSAGL